MKNIHRDTGTTPRHALGGELSKLGYSRSGGFGCLTHLANDGVPTSHEDFVAGNDNESDRPFDEFSRYKTCNPSVIHSALGRWKWNPDTENGQCDRALLSVFIGTGCGTRIGWHKDLLARTLGLPSPGLSQY
jgi:hypothetical protein